MRRVVVLAASAVAVTGLAACVLLLPGDGAPGGAGAAQAGGAARAAAPGPADPLTTEEIRRAAALATAGMRSHLAAGRAQLLYVERDDAKDGEGARRAEAYVYDYARDELTVRTVDLGQGRVVREVTDRGVQPPPSRQEEAHAAELLLRDPRFGDGVRSAYRRAAGRELGSAADLALRGLIHSAPRGACARHRCLRLFVRLPDGTFLDTSRIVVDLSAKKVHTLEW
ncbi:Tat pathway signal sequence domain protein [Nonomuraea indica]|uniref:Tat pathway signal sequence domain protein n=1 Tax=Nonomuraea indica TaxID=1581193 RepID=A0ABW8AAK5_9ACTN|nr:Tat pathway signal sequence domain protein [Nonomuraea indica]